MTCRFTHTVLMLCLFTHSALTPSLFLLFLIASTLVSSKIATDVMEMQIGVKGLVTTEKEWCYL